MMKKYDIKKCPLSSVPTEECVRSSFNLLWENVALPQDFMLQVTVFTEHAAGVHTDLFFFNHSNFMCLLVQQIRSEVHNHLK